MLRPIMALAPIRIPLVGLALGVQDGPVVDERVVPDFNLVRMAEDDVPAEDDAPADLP